MFSRSKRFFQYCLVSVRVQRWSRIDLLVKTPVKNLVNFEAFVLSLKRKRFSGVGIYNTLN